MSGRPQIPHAAPPTGNVVAVGVDLTSTAAVRRAIDAFGDGFLHRVFTAGELAECGNAADPAPRLAARFAAKEAAFKALRVEEAQPAWTSIEVLREPGGWCRLGISGRAAGIAKERGVAELLVSLTHEDELAAAVVVATAADQDPAASSASIATDQQQLRVGAEEPVVVQHQDGAIGISEQAAEAER